MDGTAISKTVTIYIAGKKDGPKMDLRVTLPANAKRPVPVFMLAGGLGQPNPEICKRGYGTVSVRIDQVQADKSNGYTNSIRAFFAPAGQTEHLFTFALADLHRAGALPLTGGATY